MRRSPDMLVMTLDRAAQSKLSDALSLLIMNPDALWDGQYSQLQSVFDEEL